MAIVHDVQIGANVRSTVRVDDVPGAGPRVVRLGNVVDGQGRTVEAQQAPTHKPLIDFGGLGYCLFRAGCAATDFGVEGSIWLIKGFFWATWNLTHLFVLGARKFFEKVDERMREYVLDKHITLSFWVDRDGYALKLPADVVEPEPEAKQLPEETVVNLLPKSKKKVSA